MCNITECWFACNTDCWGPITSGTDALVISDISSSAYYAMCWMECKFSIVTKSYKNLVYSFLTFWFFIFDLLKSLLHVELPSLGQIIGFDSRFETMRILIIWMLENYFICQVCIRPSASKKLIHRSWGHFRYRKPHLEPPKMSIPQLRGF